MYHYVEIFLIQEESNMNIGYQLSSITPYLQTRDELSNAFRKISRLGYKFVQLQGASMDIPDEFIRAELDENGLTCVAIQVDYPDGFGECPQRHIDRAIACGAKYLTFAIIPWDIKTVDALEEFAGTVREINKLVNDAGLIFAFHPIGPDFRLMEGEPVYERFMKLMPDSMQLTFCVHSTFDSPVSYSEVFDKFSGRMDLVHFKDSVLLPDGKAQLMPLGAGRTDWQPIAAKCAKAGVKWVFAEQENWQKDAFECAEDSLNYLKKLEF